MASTVLIDTDVIIDYLRNRPEAVAYLDNAIERLAISTITVAELYAGIRDGEKPTVAAFLNAFEIVPLTRTIAEKGGLYRRDYGKSHGVGLGDGLIAASSEEINADLVTLNAKHFPMLSHIVVPYQKP